MLIPVAVFLLDTCKASESEHLLLFITLTPSFVRTAALWLNRRVRRFLVCIGHPETACSESHTHGPRLVGGLSRHVGSRACADSTLASI